MATFLVTTASDAGPGSLRQILDTANNNPGPDVIDFEPGLLGQTITLTDGALTITDSVIIDGDLNDDGTPDITVDADRNSRVFDIDDGNGISDRTVVLDGLVVTGGRTTDEGGGIRSREDLTVRNSTVSGNTAVGSYGSYGGGIDNRFGNLTVSNSTISGNTTTAYDSHGGGIYNTNGVLSMTDSTLSGNAATGAYGYGGGIYQFGDLGDQTVTISNSTLSANLASYTGGGVYNANGLLLRNSTVTDNTAPPDRGSGVASRGDDATRTRVTSSIIADNTDTDVDIVAGAVNAFRSSNNNLIGTGNALKAFNRPADLTDVLVPSLGALADNGGPTLTHALLAGSPAIDAGKNPDDLATDQRGMGFPRVSGGDPDIGAFESGIIFSNGFETAGGNALGAVVDTPPPLTMISSQGGGLLGLMLLLGGGVALLARHRHG